MNPGSMTPACTLLIIVLGRIIAFQRCLHLSHLEMAIHSSTLAWKIPWMEEPGRLQSRGLKELTGLSDFPSFLPILWDKEELRLQRGLNLLVSWPWVEEVILDYPGSPSAATVVLIRERGRQEIQYQIDTVDGDAALTKAEDGGRGHQPRKSWKRQENRFFFPLASRRDTALQTLFLAVPSGMWDISSSTRDKLTFPTVEVPES